MTVSVIGLGKIGLPLACQYADRGHKVIGCDVREDLVRAVNRGECPVPGEHGLADLVRRLVSDGSLTSSTETTKAVRRSDVVIMIPPLALAEDGAPDYRAVEAASRAVGAGLRRGAVVVYETTMAVGDTRNRFGAILEHATGTRMGEGFALAFSPERVLMGRIFADLSRYPKIVGGVDAESTERAAAFYRTVLDAPVVAVDDCETAEFVKLAETTYRDVNIALANELAAAAERWRIDACQAFELANTQPYSHLHMPGAGVGGHCIPVYPRLLMAGAPELRLPAAARAINDAMPRRVVDVLDVALGGLAGRRIAVLGLSFRADVKEATLSPTWPVLDRLANAGATPLLADPWFDADELAATGAEVLHGPPVADGTLILAKHTCFRQLDLGKGGVVVDGRPGAWEPTVTGGQRVYVLGRGWRR